MRIAHAVLVIRDDLAPDPEHPDRIGPVPIRLDEGWAPATRHAVRTITEALEHGALELTTRAVSS